MRVHVFERFLFRCPPRQAEGTPLGGAGQGECRFVANMSLKSVFKHLRSAREAGTCPDRRPKKRSLLHVPLRGTLNMVT